MKIGNNSISFGGVYMSMKKFIVAVKGFVKRNSYALAVGFSILAIFAIISAVSVADLYKVKETTTKTTPDPETIEIVEKKEDAKETASETVIVFEEPIKNGSVSKEYAADHLLEDKTTGVWKTHQAIDYTGSEGTEVMSVFDGVVESVNKDIMEGTVIVIKHTNNLKTIYKSLSSSCVAVGDNVKTGEVIGVMGTNTSEKAEGTHLHFEVKLDDKLVDPNLYLGQSNK